MGSSSSAADTSPWRFSGAEGFSSRAAAASCADSLSDDFASETDSSGFRVRRFAFGLRHIRRRFPVFELRNVYRLCVLESFEFVRGGFAEENFRQRFVQCAFAFKREPFRQIRGIYLFVLDVLVLKPARFLLFGKVLFLLLLAAVLLLVLPVLLTVAAALPVVLLTVLAVVLGVLVETAVLLLVLPVLLVAVSIAAIETVVVSVAFLPTVAVVVLTVLIFLRMRVALVVDGVFVFAGFGNSALVVGVVRVCAIPVGIQIIVGSGKRRRNVIFRSAFSPFVAVGFAGGFRPAVWKWS